MFNDLADPLQNVNPLFRIQRIFVLVMHDVSCKADPFMAKKKMHQGDLVIVWMS